jgi:hypothetical protein
MTLAGVVHGQAFLHVDWIRGDDIKVILITDERLILAYRIKQGEVPMKLDPRKSVFTGNLEHRGGKKLSQQGVEFSQEAREVRKHPTRSFRGRKG